MWRLVCDPRISASLREIETEWTIADVWDAMVYLEILEDAEIVASRRLRETKKA